MSTFLREVAGKNQGYDELLRRGQKLDTADCSQDRVGELGGGVEAANDLERMKVMARNA